jgi:hypothetical protein
MIFSKCLFTTQQKERKPSSSFCGFCFSPLSLALVVLLLVSFAGTCHFFFFLLSPICHSNYASSPIVFCLSTGGFFALASFLPSHLAPEPRKWNRRILLLLRCCLRQKLFFPSMMARSGFWIPSAPLWLSSASLQAASIRSRSLNTFSTHNLFLLLLQIMLSHKLNLNIASFFSTYLTPAYSRRFCFTLRCVFARPQHVFESQV